MASIAAASPATDGSGDAATAAVTPAPDASSSISCKWGKERFDVPFSPNSTTVADLRGAIAELTTIPVTGIKLLNLKKRKKRSQS